MNVFLRKLFAVFSESIFWILTNSYNAINRMLNEFIMMQSV